MINQLYHVLVIPDYTSASFTIRGKTLEVLNALKPRVYGCFEAAGEATGCTEANGTKDVKIFRKRRVFGWFIFIDRLI